MWDQLAETLQQAVGHRGCPLLVLVLVLVLDGPSSGVCGQQHPEQAVSEDGVLWLPLRLAVQVAQERRKHGDVGRLTPVNTYTHKHTMGCICVACDTMATTAAGGKWRAARGGALSTDGLGIHALQQLSDWTEEAQGLSCDRPVSGLLDEVINLQEQRGPAVRTVLQHRDEWVRAAPAKQRARRSQQQPQPRGCCSHYQVSPLMVFLQNIKILTFGLFM